MLRLRLRQNLFLGSHCGRAARRIVRQRRQRASGGRRRGWLTLRAKVRSKGVGRAGRVRHRAEQWRIEHVHGRGGILRSPLHLGALHGDGRFRTVPVHCHIHADVDTHAGIHRRSGVLCAGRVVIVGAVGATRLRWHLVVVRMRSVPMVTGRRQQHLRMDGVREGGLRGGKALPLTDRWRVWALLQNGVLQRQQHVRNVMRRSLRSTEVRGRRGRWYVEVSPLRYARYRKTGTITHL